MNQLFTATLGAHTLDWATTQQDKCPSYLLSRTGPSAVCQAVGIATLDDLTTRAVAGGAWTRSPDDSQVAHSHDADRRSLRTSRNRRLARLSPRSAVACVD